MSRRLRTAEAPRVFFGDVIYDPGGACGPRVQADYQVVAVLAGEARADVAGREVVVPARHMALFRPGRREFFRFAPAAKTHHTWCALHPSLVPPAPAAAGARAPDVLPLTRRAEALLELGLSLPRQAGAAAHPLLEALGRAVLEEYLFAGQGAEGADAGPDALRRALEWVAQAGEQPAGLDTLAREAGVSPAQLVKLFRRHLGTTPMRYVWEARTQRGAQLLGDTGLGVAEIAYRCGFRTPFHFSRWVRHCYGVAPRALRARAWSRGAPQAAGAAAGRPRPLAR